VEKVEECSRLWGDTLGSDATWRKRGRECFIFPKDKVPHLEDVEKEHI
jgi:hypothetical protein